MKNYRKLCKKLTINRFDIKNSVHVINSRKIKLNQNKSQKHLRLQSLKKL